MFPDKQIKIKADTKFKEYFDKSTNPKDIIKEDILVL